MEWRDIARRIEAGEDGKTEFKRDLAELSGIGRAICAFANAEGGLIILGVDDGGAIVGVREDPDSALERLTGFLHSGCSVPVPARCGRHNHANGWVHWIEVPRQRGFEPLHHRGRVWIRRERSSVEPSPTELQELYNTFGFVLTEEQVIPAASMEDIDAGAFRSFLRAQGLDTEEEPQPAFADDLRNRRILAEFDGALRPTLYGLMAFGKEPQAHPQTTSFFVQCIAYSGEDRASEVILAGEGKGRLDEQVRRAAGWVRGLGWTERYHGLEREDRPLVPEKALREAIVNAVVHRDYAITGARVLRGIREPHRRDQPRHPPQPYEGRECPLRRKPQVAKRVDGERRPRRPADGAAGTGMAGHAQSDAGIQRHRAGAGAGRRREVRAGDVPDAGGGSWLTGGRCPRLD